MSRREGIAAVKLSAVNTDDGSRYETEAPELNEDVIRNLESEFLSERKVREFIDNLDWSADAKLQLMRMYETTIQVGESLFRLGRFIISCTIKLVTKMPNTTFGTILGAIIGALIASVPVIGFVLGPIATPLAILLGAAWGVREDIRDAVVGNAIEREVRRFDAFRNA